MDSASIRDHLAALHRELAGSGPVDPQTRALLDEVLHDITRLTAAGAAPAAMAQSPTDRLERVAVQFEADHPAIAANVRRLVELLGRAGV